jgi:hypothetical protein
VATSKDTYQKKITFLFGSNDTGRRRTIQYIKDRTGWFYDYFPCTRTNYKLGHILNWLVLFVDMHNRGLMIMQRVVK